MEHRGGQERQQSNLLLFPVDISSRKVLSPIPRNNADAF